MRCYELGSGGLDEEAFVGLVGLGVTADLKLRVSDDTGSDAVEW